MLGNPAMDQHAIQEGEGTPLVAQYYSNRDKPEWPGLLRPMETLPFTLTKSNMCAICTIYVRVVSCKLAMISFSLSLVFLELLIGQRHVITSQIQEPIIRSMRLPSIFSFNLTQI